MFHLQAGIGLHEDEAVGRLVDEEFHRGEGHDAARAAERHRRIEDAVPEGRVKPGGRGDLDELLVAALEAAFPLVEMAHGAGLVAEDLHLDVAGGTDQLLHIEPVGAEAGLRLRGGAGEGIGEARAVSTTRMPRPPPPASALTMTGRPSRSAMKASASASVVIPVVPAASGTPTSAARRRAAPCRRTGQRLGLRADEGEPGGRAGAGETGILRQEAVAGMDGVAAFRLRRRDDGFAVEIGRRAATGERHRGIGRVTCRQSASSAG